MKSPFEYTISEAIALLGETSELMSVVCKIFNKQQEIKIYQVKEVAKLISKSKLNPKVEPVYLSQKAFLDASQG